MVSPNSAAQRAILALLLRFIPGLYPYNRSGRLSRSMGATYCWGVPRGIVLGFEEGEVGMEGGRLRTRGSLAE